MPRTGGPAPQQYAWHQGPLLLPSAVSTNHALRPVSVESGEPETSPLVPPFQSWPRTGAAALISVWNDAELLI